MNTIYKWKQLVKSRRKNTIQNVITFRLFKYVRRILRQKLESFFTLRTHQVSKILVQENNVIREHVSSMEYKNRLRNVVLVWIYLWLRFHWMMMRRWQGTNQIIRLTDLQHCHPASRRQQSTEVNNNGILEQGNTSGSSQVFEMNSPV